MDGGDGAERRRHPAPGGVAEHRHLWGGRHAGAGDKGGGQHPVTAIKERLCKVTPTQSVGGNRSYHGRPSLGPARSGGFRAGPLAALPRPPLDHQLGRWLRGEATTGGHCVDARAFPARHRKAISTSAAPPTRRGRPAAAEAAAAAAVAAETSATTTGGWSRLRRDRLCLWPETDTAAAGVGGPQWRLRRKHDGPGGGGGARVPDDRPDRDGAAPTSQVTAWSRSHRPLARVQEQVAAWLQKGAQTLALHLYTEPLRLDLLCGCLHGESLDARGAKSLRRPPCAGTTAGLPGGTASLLRHARVARCGAEIPASAGEECRLHRRLRRC